jgi:hypothetical protein
MKAGRSVRERAEVRGVTVLGSYEGSSTYRILLIVYSLLETAQDIGSPSPPTPSPRGRGEMNAFGID